MKKQKGNHLRLGIFVMAGLLFLVLLLYMIGRNRSLFRPTYVLKARFEHVHGLVPGNNVRYAGIQAGTVKTISIVNDTTIEVTMIIEKRMANIIRKNAEVSIGTEGFVGNKVVSITPIREKAPFAVSGDLLASKRSTNTDAILENLEKTSYDLVEIASGLRQTISRVNESEALWQLLQDEEMPNDLRSSIRNIRQTTARTSEVVNELAQIVESVEEGKGSIGQLITDSSFAHELQGATQKVREVGQRADSLMMRLNGMLGSLQQQLEQGQGTAGILLSDSTTGANLQASLENIRRGTAAFEQNMEALKHNFLLRGYFRKLEKQKKKEGKQ
jgi:phospholipid/cholesterol/gamma-HCH transport system substrate-binding protein